MIRRINLFGGPGVGKSSTAAKIFSILKQQNYNIEIVSEWIKTWSYQKYQLKSFDQFYCFGKQLRKEDVLLSNGVQLVISDSPLILNVSYSKKYNHEYWRPCLHIAELYERKYPSLNILLHRDVPYETKGRYESYHEAVFMDNYIHQFLKENNIKYLKSRTLDFDNILNYILGEIKDGN